MQSAFGISWWSASSWHLAENSFCSQERGWKGFRTLGTCQSRALVKVRGFWCQRKTVFTQLSQGWLLLRMMKERENKDAWEGKLRTEWSVSLSCVSWRSVCWGALRRSWWSWGVRDALLTSPKRLPRISCRNLLFLSCNLQFKSPEKDFRDDLEMFNWQ